MMNTLEEEEIAALVDPSFALLVQHWDSFNSGIQGQAYEMVDNLMKSHSSMICDIVHTLPSLASIPLMAKFEEQLSALKARMDVKHHFLAFSERCQNENATVVLTALDELTHFLAKHQSFLHETANSEQPDVVVSQLLRSILDTSVLFSSTHPEISVLCARCLGLIGCLDPTRIEATREKREILVLSNFVRDDETNDFVVFFLREVLVKAFLSATNSRSQGFLAYAMQELLSISEIRDAVISRSRDGLQDANYRRWVSLRESVRTTLMPFTDSKYFVTAGVSQSPCTYPLYSGEMTHGQWLRTFTFDLLKRTVGTGKVQTIFSVLSRIVRFQDISISHFLLPFACLNIIVSGVDHDRRELERELLQVLLHSLPDQGPRRDSVILCSQVSAAHARLRTLLSWGFSRRSSKCWIICQDGCRRRRRRKLPMLEVQERERRGLCPKLTLRGTCCKSAVSNQCLLSYLRTSYLEEQWSVNPIPGHCSIGSNISGNKENEPRPINKSRIWNRSTRDFRRSIPRLTSRTV